MMEDQREDMMGAPETRWNDFTSTVQNIGDFIFEWKDNHCQGPCFVNTSNSIDNTRMGAPTSPLRETPVAASSYPARDRSPAPSAPIRFPSVHLDMDDWDDADDTEVNDSAYFFEARNGGAMMPSSNGSPPPTMQILRQQQSIYRTPSSATSPLASPMAGCFAPQTMTTAATAGQYPPIPSAGAGLYRSPAWAAIADDDTDDDTDEVLSIDDSCDGDWHGISPQYSPVASSQQLTDISNVEKLFNGDFSLSGSPR